MKELGDLVQYCTVLSQNSRKKQLWELDSRETKAWIAQRKKDLREHAIANGQKPVPDNEDNNDDENPLPFCICRRKANHTVAIGWSDCGVDLNMSSPQ